MYMRHRRFLSKKHRYRHTSMNQFFDKEDKPQTDEPEKTSYGQKVFEMVKGINGEGHKHRVREEEES